MEERYRLLRGAIEILGKSDPPIMHAAAGGWSGFSIDPDSSDRHNFFSSLLLASRYSLRKK